MIMSFLTIPVVVMSVSGFADQYAPTIGSGRCNEISVAGILSASGVAQVDVLALGCQKQGAPCFHWRLR